jgi:Uma2 family endonuclease
MSAYPKLRKFTPQEYLKIERAATFKSEYVDGQIYAMSGSTLGHNSIALNSAFSLRMRLKGKGCTPFAGDVRVSVSKEGPYFYPDFIVVCDKARPDWRKDIVAKPVLVGEVQSESTARYDREVKLKAFQMMPSVLDIVFISQSKVKVQHYFRDSGKLWRSKVYTALEESVPLAGLATALPLADVYEGLDFS